MCEYKRFELNIKMSPHSNMDEKKSHLLTVEAVCLELKKKRNKKS